MSISSYAWVNWLWLIVLLAFPFFLWILPSGFFDEGPTLCLSQLIFQLECIGCGLTRAVMHLHHFELADALYNNMLVVVVYPLLVYLWFIWVRAALRRLGLWKSRKEIS